MRLTYVTVGFTGSGQEMRKDPSRSRHIYQQGADEEGYWYCGGPLGLYKACLTDGSSEILAHTLTWADLIFLVLSPTLNNRVSLVTRFGDIRSAESSPLVCLRPYAVHKLKLGAADFSMGHQIILPAAIRILLPVPKVESIQRFIRFPEARKGWWFLISSSCCYLYCSCRGCCFWISFKNPEQAATGRFGSPTICCISFMTLRRTSSP